MTENPPILPLKDTSPENSQAPSEYETVKRVTLATVAESSAKTYNRTYTLWENWADTHGVDRLNLTPIHVLDFLRSRAVTKNTRQRQLSALRKMARIMALDYTSPERKAVYEALLLIKAPSENLGGTERERRTLKARQIWKILEYWHGDKPINKRNRALLAVLFYTGMRRSEVVALRWADIDLETGVIDIRHGKGDKQRYVAIVGDTAIDALKAWNQPARGREYVFCAVRKGDKLADDKPMGVRAVNQIIEKTSNATGIVFKTHDARRTLATDVLNNGGMVADVQAQLGHANPATTLSYAMAADVRKRRSTFKTSY